MFSRARSLLAFLTIRQWWGALGLLLLLVLLWSASRMLAWPLTVPLAGTIALLVLGLVALLVDRYRAVRSATALERSIRSQADEQLFSVRPERREQIEQVEREFAAAVEALKRSKVGKQRPGQSALYALPWYVVIGPPAAGKTTAITESGLDFPMGANRVRGVGGTRNCEWFFSTSAILLDTAGRYMTVDEDRDEWLTFLGLLKRYRRRTPLNGVLVVVSIDEILNASAEELQQLAVDLRHRMDELLAQLGIRFPLYLVFTKCDLLRGFTEFFADLDPAARGQVWGCTAPKNANGSDDVQQQFEHEFDLLARTLVTRRTTRLSNLAADPDVAREVYLFPLEFASIRDSLAAFVGQLLQPNPYQDTPQFRGFYFTSALQGGESLDRVLPAITDSYEISRWDTERNAPVESHGYFLKSLFRDVIVHDRARVGPTSREATTRERMRRGTLAATTLGLVAFAWVSIAAFTSSSSDLGVAERAIATAKRQPGLASLDTLGHAIALLESREPASFQVQRVGLDRSTRLLPQLRGVYVRHARSHFTAPLFAPIERRLRVYSAPSPEARNDLRAYLLLGAEMRRLQENEQGSEQERLFLQRYFQRQLVGRERDTVYTNRFVNALGKAEVPIRVVNADARLVDSTRTLLYVPPTIDQLYASLREEGTRGGRRVPIAKMLGQPTSIPFDPSSSVPWLFTKEAWEEFVPKAIEERSEAPSLTDWVVGARPENLPPNLADPKAVAQQLTKRYFDEYAVVWEQFLAGIRYPAGDIGTSARALQALGDPSKSALVVLLDSTLVQTHFDNLADAGKQKYSEYRASLQRAFGIAGPASDTTGPRNPVDRAFAPLHALRDKSGAAALSNILREYQSFGQSLEAAAPRVGESFTTSQLLAEAARGRVAVGAAASMIAPAIRLALLERPFEIAEAAVRSESGGAAAQKWRDQVCKPFRTLAAGYPFSKGGPDATLADVERFFQPQGGAIWAYYERELSNILSPVDFRPVQAGGRGAVAPTGASETLRDAKRIRDALFTSSGGMQVQFSLLPEPLKLVGASSGRRPSPTKVCITVDGQDQCYQNGEPIPRDFEWPARTGSKANRIVVTVSESGKQVQLSLEEAGDWGWYRLLEHADVSALGGVRLHAVWTVPGQGYAVEVAYTITVRGGINPFNGRSLFTGFRCSSGS